MRYAIAIAAAAAFLSPQAALAWGEDGHSIVAEIAQHRLTPTAAATVQALLAAEYPAGLRGPFSLAAVASWADDYRAGHKETTNWHFVSIPINVPGQKPADVRYDPQRDCPPATDEKGTCLIEALKAQLAILATPPAAGDKAAAEKRLMALKFVVHLAGDLGQPLHCADRDGDAGGNGLHVFYSGPHQPFGELHTDFHKTWDSFILTDGHWSWGDYVGYLERDWLKGKDEAALAAGDPEAWANECHRNAVKAYGILPLDLTLGGFQLKPELQIADEALAKSALRLATLLNKALDGGP